MALDVAAGRRWPIFFDGQRYMGALEPYLAAVLVRLFGHAPAVVAIAPTLCFALFVAGQYLLWRRWADRPTAHLAALFAVACAPLLVLWSIIPRGGYTALLAWAVPTLWAYRALTRPDAGRPGRAVQAGWGSLLAVGYFLNPLSLIVYATLAIDWTLGRHGAELRRLRRLDGSFVDARHPGLGWLAGAAAAVLALALACHVATDAENQRGEFVFVMGLLPRGLAIPLGVLGVLGLIGALAWWTGAGARAVRLLAGHPWFALGALTALSPFALYALRARLGWTPFEDSVLIWIRAPWGIGPNLRDGLLALGPLFGCDAHGAARSLSGQSAELPSPAMNPALWALSVLAPALVALAGALVATVARRDRRAWREFFALRGDAPTRPTVLALLGVGTAFVLYQFQASSADASSIRYLVPAWIFLPGLLATGLRAWPPRARGAALAAMVGLWGASHVALWGALDRTTPVRPLAAVLVRRGVPGVIAPTAVALQVANLSSGRVGGLEYHSFWPRIHDRYADRFDDGGPYTCIVDRNIRWPRHEDLGLRLAELRRRFPGRIRRADNVGSYEIWEADVPLQAILAPDPGPVDELPGP